MEQNNTNKPKTLFDVARENGNQITLEQLAKVVDDARNAFEKLAKERRDTNYNNYIDYHRPIN